jgi:hypothetical protein
VDPERTALHGEIIYIFRNTKTNQIIYSLQELLDVRITPIDAVQSVDQCRTTTSNNSPSSASTPSRPLSVQMNGSHTASSLSPRPPKATVPCGSCASFAACTSWIGTRPTPSSAV